MIDFIIKNTPIILSSLLFIFNFFLKMYLSKLINAQITNTRCTKNVNDISKKIKSISRILTVSKFIQTVFFLLYISRNDSLKEKIFNVLEKLDTIKAIKYILYVSVFILYILMLSPVSDIKSLCGDHKIGKNMLYIIINWLCISIIILIGILVAIRKFKTMKKNRYDDDLDFN